MARPDRPDDPHRMDDLHPHTAEADVPLRAPGSGFRHLLRHATRPQHDEAERIFAPFSVLPTMHLDWFLQTQWVAFSALLTHRGPGSEPRAARLLDRLASTLALDCSGDLTASAPARRCPSPGRAALTPEADRARSVDVGMVA